MDSNLEKVDAIILDQAQTSTVDKVWIQQVYRQGIAIAAVNVTVHDLAELVGDTEVSSDPSWADGWQKEPFFSIIAFKSSSGYFKGSPEEQQLAASGAKISGTRIASTDNIRQPSDVEVFLSFLRQAIRDVQ